MAEKRAERLLSEVHVLCLVRLSKNPNSSCEGHQLHTPAYWDQRWKSQNLKGIPYIHGIQIGEDLSIPFSSLTRRHDRLIIIIQSSSKAG
jgi:hypothetical protein